MLSQCQTKCCHRWLLSTECLVMPQLSANTCTIAQIMTFNDYFLPHIVGGFHLGPPAMTDLSERRWGFHYIPCP